MMDAKYLAEIKARDSAELPETDAPVFHDRHALIAEVERQTQRADEWRSIAAEWQGKALNADKQIAALTTERDDSRRQFGMYGGDEGITAVLQEWDTLKKALELACDDAADGCCPNEMTDYICPNAQNCPNANGNREDSGLDKECWHKYFIHQAQEGKK